jgi:alpha-tubulin suppressor-like RCC1 family protein
MHTRADVDGGERADAADVPDAGDLPDAADACVRCDAAAQISAGQLHTCARLGDGRVVCWGDDSAGQIGDGTIGGSRPPTAVDGIDDAVDVAAGGEHTCAVRATGSIVCWGRNDRGQLGDGTTTARSTPAEVPGITDAVEIGAGLGHSCARHASGTVSCWGSNLFYQLGEAAPLEWRGAPLEVAGVTDAVQLETGFRYNCARRRDGTVLCWGDGTFGQLGREPGHRSTAEAVPAFDDAVEIATGANHTCARRSGGIVVCWGIGALLGDGTVGNDAFPTPARVTGLVDAVRIDAGDAHTCAVRADGSVVCWGNDWFGQLGDAPPPESRMVRATPIGVAMLSGAEAVSAGRMHTCALAAGTVSCWGNDDAGQVGATAPGNVLTPTVVAMP